MLIGMLIYVNNSGVREVLKYFVFGIGYAGLHSAQWTAFHPK